MKYLLLGLICLTSLTALKSAPAITGLRPSHPRLIAGASSWDDLRARRLTDPQLAALLSAVENEARRILTQPPVEYHKTGRRLLHVSRLMEERTLTLAMTFQLTRDPVFLRRAEAEMLAAAGFTDWNPSHFLDVGEMTAGLALGYDWLYADLSPAIRTQLRSAIVRNGLQPALDPHASYNGWQNTDNNWNQVCFGGLILGALAVGDEEPVIAGQILTLARSRIDRGLGSYAPDGVFPEGPAYWTYGTSYTVLTVAALQTALGTDWKIPTRPGFLPSAGAFLQLTAPSGQWFNFSDCTESGSFEPILFWFARQLGDPGLIQSQLAALSRLVAHGHLPSESARFLPLVALWWPEHTGAAAVTLPLRWFGDGSNPVAVFRGSWTDPNAFYLGLKGGNASLSHAHMDAGSFVFEANGVRWARDLGSQEYESLESKGVDLWNRAQESQRWQVFRLNNYSHNTLTIDGQLHRVGGAARITGFSDAAAHSCALVDLSPVFAGQAGRVRRGFRVLPDQAVLVQDELAGLKPGAEVMWTMVTGAEVSIESDGRRAILRENGRSCEVRLLAPTAARLTVVPATPLHPAYDTPNPNRRLIQVHAAARADGALTIAVRLNPNEAKQDTVAALEPLDQWLPGK
jgi:hypothetical protein